MLVLAHSWVETCKLKNTGINRNKVLEYRIALLFYDHICMHVEHKHAQNTLNLQLSQQSKMNISKSMPESYKTIIKFYSR